MKVCQLLLIAALALMVVACQPTPIRIIIFADGGEYSFTTTQRNPIWVLEEAGLSLDESDRLLYLGKPVDLETTLPLVDNIILIVRRAINLTLFSPDNNSLTLKTSAWNVGEALLDAGFSLHSSDLLDPPPDTPIFDDIDVIWQPASRLMIDTNVTQVYFRSAASTIGGALAETGIPLIGLDYSIPAETQALPEDGLLQVVHVTEGIALTLKSIPFGTRTEFTADLEIDQQELIQGGESGLAASRLRTRLEDGVLVSQISESETVIQPAQDQILGIGTNIVIRTTVVDGEEIEYWRALSLFATYYIPCNPGDAVCYFGTASGTLVRKGAVAFVYPWYLLFAGERLYIPGYGFGTVEDNNGALTNTLGDTYWIDLGYSLEDEIDWVNQYVTVYFLTPVPANVADTYILP